ncbi:KHG/KDPG aldolase [Thalictrum thalictroides]|uniref:KHG/KDPG aldolase n=1 Tax=Thalictrum thalictroides TaxID=46969 RepID=A0A7J6VVI7_THATH|nr:KHG/KDPG aldolase [Thalictrum thalictroides]
MLVGISASLSSVFVFAPKRIRRRRTPSPSPSSSNGPGSSPSCYCSSLSPLATTTLAAIQTSGIIACLRAQSGELAMKAAQAALNAGISVLEITMTTPDVFEVLQGLVQQYPSSILGVGTVLNVVGAQCAIKAGAKFLMSPAIVKDIMDDIQGDEVLYIPGVMTPSEVLTAYDAGARIVKVYPVSILGGDQYISALKKPFSHIPMVASQGITLDSIGRYLYGGASAVVLSDAIFEKEAMNKRSYDRIYELACLAAAQGKGIKRQITVENPLPRPC